MAASLRNDPHSRRFGVEIECGMHGGTREACSVLGFPSGAYSHKGFSIGADGSGVEVRTPILQGWEGFAVLRDTIEKLKAAGAYVTERDGLHVHHDAPEFVASPSYCVRIVHSWNNNLGAIHSMVAPRRRRDGGPAPSWSPRHIQALEDWAKNGGRQGDLYIDRNDLNLSSLRRHGSIEIRLHEGTLDSDVAMAWVMFGQKFISDVLKRARPIAPVPSEEKLLSRIKLSKKAQKTLREKQAMAHVTPATAFHRTSPSY